MAVFFISSLFQLLLLMLWISHNTVCSEGSFFTLLYKGIKNSTDDWVDMLTAQVAIKKSEEHINVFSTRNIEETGEKRIITIMGMTNNQPVVFNATTGREGSKGLLFHPQCESNCFITNEGRTVRRIAPGRGNSGSFTNRPLKDNEIFEVRIEGKPKGKGHVFIGVTTIEPPSITGKIKMVNTWTYFENKFLINGEVLKKYGKNNNDIMEGKTLGVMRTDSGDLHFFFDGIGQGLAYINIPPNVYGYLALMEDGITATIVNS